MNIHSHLQAVLVVCTIVKSVCLGGIINSITSHFPISEYLSTKWYNTIYFIDIESLCNGAILLVSQWLTATERPCIVDISLVFLSILPLFQQLLEPPSCWYFYILNVTDREIAIRHILVHNGAQLLEDPRSLAASY